MSRKKENHLSNLADHSKRPTLSWAARNKRAPRTAPPPPLIMADTPFRAAVKCFSRSTRKKKFAPPSPFTHDRTSEFSST